MNLNFKINYLYVCVKDIKRAIDFIKRLHELKCEIVFPLTVIGRNEVLEFKDSEGNYIEVTSPIKGY